MMNDNMKPLEREIKRLTNNKFEKQQKIAYFNLMLKEHPELINHIEIKPSCNCSHCIDIAENLDKYNDIEEWLGFNYKEYREEIIKAVQKDDFDLLLAMSAIEREAGKFTEEQIIELKKIMEVGFTKSKNLKEMAKEIDKKVKPNDLFKIKNGALLLGVTGLPILMISKEKRSISIIRTEVTRLASIGAENHYKSKGIKNVRWITSFGTRTCPECEALDNQIFNIGEGPRPQLHTNCRCMIVAVPGVGQ